MLESKISEVVVLFPSLFCLVLCTSNSFRWAILIWIFILILGIHQQGFGNNVLSPKFLGKWGGGGCWQWINVKLNDHWNKPNTRKEHSRDRGINTCRIQNWSTPSKHVQSGHYRPATETPSEWHFAGRPIVAQVWMLADPWADPGIFARVVQARLPENSSDNGFCLFLSSTFTVLQWLINGLFQRKL